MSEPSKMAAKRAGKPNWTEDKSGRILYNGTEVGEKEAAATLERNAKRRKANESQLQSASDEMTRTMMKRFSDLANENFDADERELRPILERRKAASATKPAK